MSLFRLDASIRVEGSVSRAIGDIVESSWRDAQPDATVTRRQIGLDPLPSTVWAAAVSGGRTEESQRSPEQIDALTLAASLVDELVDAEAILIATPLYNYGVSQHLKAWIDLAITDPRLAAGGGQPLRDKPAVLVIVRGGAYGPGTPREGWDHAIGWIRRILEDVWGLDLRVVAREFTLVGQVPALDEFTEIAVEMRHEAERLAGEHGRHLAAVGAN